MADVLSGTYAQRIAYNTATLAAGSYWNQTDAGSDGAGNSYPAGYYQWTGFVWSLDNSTFGANMGPISVKGQFNDSTGATRPAVFADMIANPNGNDSGYSVGVFGKGETAYGNTFNQATLAGVIGYANHFGTGTVTSLQGVAAAAQHQNAGTVTTGAGGIFAIVLRGSGTMNNGIAVYATSPTIATAGTLTNAYGVYIENQGAASMSNSFGLRILPQSGAGASWAIYSDGGASYHSGNFQMGGAMVYSGEITPTALAGATDNWNPTGLSTASVIRISASAPVNLTGIQAQTAGTEITLVNVGANTITLVNASTSTAANQFQLKANISLAQWGSVRLRYDTTLSKWLCVGTY
jgi:hypothetical protein